MTTSSYDPANDYKIEEFEHHPHIIPSATTTIAGVMSAADKVKLDGIPVGGDNILLNVPAAVAVGDVLVLAGVANTGAKANAAAYATTSAIVGVVSSKPTPTTAYANPVGECPFFLGLIPGALYYVSAVTPGAITITPPSTVGQVVQQVGYAKNATTLVVQFGDPIVL